jgi:hypothetical protein
MKHFNKNVLTTFLILVAILFLPLTAAAAAPILAKGEAPSPPWNRLSDYDEVTSYLKGYAAAYPDWVTLESIGKSAQGRDMWLVTLHNKATGDELGKPAMYVDGNTHANEVQGTEATVYTLDFLLHNYGHLERVTELMDRAVFYFVPMVNPDGRARWFEGPSTAHFPRTVMQAVDDDRDGVADEDGYDDLDGDGIITQMRKKVPLGEGGYKLHPKDSRILVEVEGEEKGDYIRLGSEGYDNDGDGRVNEDNIGYVDPNRTWGYDWQPEYVQGGAGPYPLSIPETRAIATWALTKPNIIGAQSFHNNGKMILRGPGAKSEPKFSRFDLESFDLIGEEGARMLPGYRYMIVWKDLYTTFGATDDHFYRVHGAVSFTNELYEPPTDLDGDGETSDEERMEFNDVITLGRQFVGWSEVDHPQYGKVEVGGMRHDVGRVPEGWMLEEETHRNAAFVLFHAYQMPKLAFGEPEVTEAGKNLWRLEVPVRNERAIPTVTDWARKEKIHRVDLVLITGAKVVTSGLVENRFLNQIEIQKHRPERLMVPGIQGFTTRRLFFLVEGKGEVTVTYDSLKGGQIAKKVALKASGS